MQELFDEFIESPSRETYLAAREALIDSEAYNPASTEIDIAIGLIEEGKLAEAGAVIAAAEDNLALSPRAHMVLAYLASEAGDEERMEEEGTLAAICCEGIMATGDGSREKPYIPCRVSDEYDVLEFLEKESSDQSIVEDDDRFFDCVRCEDGSEIWFDITDAYNWVGDQFVDEHLDAIDDASPDLGNLEPTGVFADPETQRVTACFVAADKDVSREDLQEHVQELWGLLQVMVPTDFVQEVHIIIYSQTPPKASATNLPERSGGIVAVYGVAARDLGTGEFVEEIEDWR